MIKKYFLLVLITPLSTLLCFVNILDSIAQPLDPSFGNNGIVITKLNEGGFDDFAKASVLQPDGKTVVAGYANQSTNSITFDAIAMRYNEDGSADDSFGNDGLVRLDVSTSDDLIYDIALQADGKLVLAGVSAGGFLLIRLMSNGTLDSSFATNGVFEYNYATSGFEQLLSVGIFSNGELLAAGLVPGDYSLVLLRLHEDGTIDSAFGNDGFIEYDNAAAKIDMKVDDMNRILICTSNAVSYEVPFFVKRFSEDGIPDSSFGVNSLAVIYFDTTAALANAMALQTDGKILLVGSSDDPANYFSPKRVALCRLLTDGTPDLSFGADGKVITDFENFQATASSIAISSTGKIIAGGMWKDVFGEEGGFFIVRYNPDGSIDSVFGTSGLAQTHAVDDLSTTTSLLINPEEKIIFSGSAINGITSYDFFISMFKENGKPDPGFGDNGIEWTNLSVHPSLQEANDLTLLPDGSMIITGVVAAVFGYGDFFVGKYESNGTLDSSFGESGITRIALDNNYYFASSIASGADGNIITGGISFNTTNFDYQAVIMKLLNNGKPDIGFGDHGKVRTNFGQGSAWLNKIAVSQDGKIAGCGYVWQSLDSTALLLFRLNANGSFDSTFSDDGVLIYDREPNTIFELLIDLSIQEDGSIIAIGNLGQVDTSIMIKVLEDGSFDSSFGNNGVITFTNGIYSYVEKMIIQPDDKILLAGGAFGNNSDDYLLFRFLSNGNTDSSFGINGRSVIIKDDYIDEAHDIGLLSDGRIVLTGFQQYLVTNNPDFPLLILSPSGIPDSTFENDGWTSIDLQGYADEAFALAVQPDDKVILAGRAYNSNGWDIGLARFITPVSTGIAEILQSSSAQLTIYPNPASESFHIENPFNQNNLMLIHSDPIFFSVKEISGTTLLSGFFSSQQSVFDISMQNIGAGIYLVELRCGDALRIGKLIRQ